MTSANPGQIVEYRGAERGLLYGKHLQVISVYDAGDIVKDRQVYCPSAHCADHSDGSTWLINLACLIPVVEIEHPTPFNNRCICDTCYTARSNRGAP